MHGRLILFVALLVACIAVPGGVSAQSATPVATTIALPTPTGPYSVGRTSFDWVDTTRDEPFSEDTADQRQLVVWVWYPTEPLPNAPHAAYLPGVWGDLVSESLRIDLSGVEIHAVEGVPLALVHQRYPVVILSPGSGFVPAFYTALSEELASHGYIVVGVNHTYNAGVTVFANGQVVPAAVEAQPQPTDTDAMIAAGEAMTKIHAADLQFVIDQLEALNAAPGMFQDRLDLSHIGILGGSLGGAAAAEVCRVDPRCDAGVNMDGLFWGEAATSGVETPFLLLMSDHQPCEEVAEVENVTVDQCETIEERFAQSWQTVHESAQPGYWVVIAGSQHVSYSDAPFLPAGADVLPSFVGGATIEPERMWRVTSDLLLAFFDAHLLGNPAPLLDGPSPDYPEVRFVAQDQ